jgi:hypothetical protein
MHFMSIEVAVQSYLFPPSHPVPSGTEIKQCLGGTLRNLTSQVPFSHNHLHDLESLWWVAIWIVFYNYFSNTAPLDDHLPFVYKDVLEHLKLTRILFPTTVKSGDRLIGFQTLFSKACSGLPSNKDDICLLLDGLCEILIGQYKVVEGGLPLSVDSNSTDDSIYETFKDIFSSLRTVYHDLVLIFIPEVHRKLRKRERSESTNETAVPNKTQRIE